MNEEQEALTYMMETVGWSIVQRKLGQKIEYHKSKLMDCEIEDVAVHRAVVKELNAFFNSLNETE